VAWWLIKGATLALMKLKGLYGHLHPCVQPSKAHPYNAWQQPDATPPMTMTMTNQETPIDLLAIREIFNRQNIMLCFNGPVTAPLIEEIGTALRKHMQGLEESPTAVSDVFSVYIEMAQNIRRYAQAQAFENETSTILISRDALGHYVISASNIVRDEDGNALGERIGQLFHLDKEALKTAFKTQLRQPRSALTGSAGLGLIDMARKASVPLQHTLQMLDNGRALFSLRVIL